jgi:hypothetical protein
MNADQLNELYGAMISPDARVSVPEEWMPAVHEAMQSFVDLPTEVRAYIIVVGIVVADGDLTLEIAGAVEYLTSSGLAMVRAITDRAVAATKGSLH